MTRVPRVVALAVHSCAIPPRIGAVSLKGLTCEMFWGCYGFEEPRWVTVALEAFDILSRVDRGQVRILSWTSMQ